MLTFRDNTILEFACTLGWHGLPDVCSAASWLERKLNVLIFSTVPTPDQFMWRIDFETLHQETIFALKYSEFVHN